MSKTLQEEIDRIVTRAVNLEYVNKPTQVKIKKYKNSATLTVPYKYSKGCFTVNVVPRDDIENEYMSISGVFTTGSEGTYENSTSR